MPFKEKLVSLSGIRGNGRAVVLQPLVKELMLCIYKGLNRFSIFSCRQLEIEVIIAGK